MNFQLIDTKQYYLSSNSVSANENNGSFNSDITYQIPKFIQRGDNILYNSIRVFIVNFHIHFIH